MRIWADCIPCSLKMALETARQAVKSEEGLRSFMERVLVSEALRGRDWAATSPEVARGVWREVCAAAGCDDPLRPVKDAQNRAAMELYPTARSLVEDSTEPITVALKCAIAGNMLDVMVGVDQPPSEALLEFVGSREVDADAVRAFEERIDRAERVVYFTDNCGEIVFDRLLIETIRDEWRGELTAVTRSRPVLNDATLEDARAVGLDRVARVVENGIREPLPGTFLAEVSAEVRDLVARADLVIAKGVGNFDSLTEERELDGRISFLLHGKCRPVCTENRVAPGALIVSNR